MISMCYVIFCMKGNNMTAHRYLDKIVFIIAFILTLKYFGDGAQCALGFLFTNGCATTKLKLLPHFWDIISPKS